MKKMTRVFCLLLAMIMVLPLCAQATTTSAPTTTTTPTTAAASGSSASVPAATPGSQSILTNKPTNENVDSSGIPIYFQTDYPYTMYANGTIASNGGSITSLAMVASYLTHYEYKPEDLAAWFGPFIGNQLQRLEYASDMLKLPWRRVYSWYEAREAVKKGNVAILLVNSAMGLTNSTHFVVLAEYTEEGTYRIIDPDGTNYNKEGLKKRLAEGFSDYEMQAMCDGCAWVYDVSKMPEEPDLFVPPDYSDIECRYPEVKITSQEKTLLAKMIWVEAQGEPFEGQQAIGEIIFNRYVLGGHGKTVTEIIEEPGQFNSTKLLSRAQPNQTQYEAVERALNGPYVLPMDVIYFSPHLGEHTLWKKISGHNFFYRDDFDPTTATEPTTAAKP